MQVENCEKTCDCYKVTINTCGFKQCEVETVNCDDEVKIRADNGCRTDEATVTIPCGYDPDNMCVTWPACNKMVIKVPKKTCC